MKVTVKKRNGGEGVEGGQVIRETLKKCFGKVLDCGKKVRLRQEHKYLYLEFFLQNLGGKCPSGLP